MKYVLLTLCIISLCSCNTNDHSNTDKNDELKNRNQLCHNLSIPECLKKSEQCELITDICLPKISSIFNVVPIDNADLNNALSGVKITALSKESFGEATYIGTNDGLIKYGRLPNNKAVEVIKDFSKGDPSLAGLSYVRALSCASLGKLCFATIGKNGDAHDPDSKIIYKLEEEKLYNTTPPSALDISHIFESTAGNIIFSGQLNTSVYSSFDDTFHSSLLSFAGVTNLTSSVLDPNKSHLWLATGGDDSTKHQGIKKYTTKLGYIVGNDISPSLWGSNASSPNANISTMAIFNGYILVGLRKTNNDANTGGIVAFSIDNQGSVINNKPFLLGVDVRKILVHDFNYGASKDAKKRSTILMASDEGLFALSFDTMNFSSIDKKIIDQDIAHNKISYQGVDHLVAGDSSKVIFTSNNKVYNVFVQ